MNVCVCTGLDIQPGLNAATRKQVVVLMVIGPEYVRPLISVGFVPFVVYRIAAPGVSQKMLSGNDAE